MAPNRQSSKETSRGDPVAWVPNSPDGGWGWMVVVGSLLIHVFADGFVYSFGTMIVELLEQFNEGKALTSWIVSTLIGLTLGAGPLASAVTHKFGCRFTTMLGAVIASVGCAVSFFATSVVFLMVSIGLVMGLGFGLMYCPAIIIVTVYFEERRAFATGIAVCGAGIGTFIFAPLSTYLINVYTWRGAFLIYSGIILNCAVCGALFRPVEFVPLYEDVENDISSSVVGLDKIAESDEISTTVTRFVPKTGPKENGEIERAHSDKHLYNGDAVLAAKNGPSPPRKERFRSYTHIIQSPSLSPTRVLRTVSHEGTEAGISPRPIFHHRHARNRGISESSGYLGIKDAFYQGSLTGINKSRPDLFRSITSVHSAAQGPIHTVLHHPARESQQRENTVEKEPVKSENFMERCTSGWLEFRQIVGEMFNPALLTDPLFVLFGISNFLTSMGFNAPLVFLPDRAVEELGIEKNQASLTLSAFGIANTIGRLIIGFVSDKKWPCRFGERAENNRLWIYNISLSVCGLFTLFTFFCKDLTSLIIYSATFGFTLSSYVCLTSVILVDLLGMEKLTNAFGLLLLSQGIASFVGPPVAGWIVDVTKSFDYAFFFAGASLAVSGLMLFAIPCVQRKLQSQNKLRKKSSVAQKKSSNPNLKEMNGPNEIELSSQ